MKKLEDYRQGALGALMDEYVRAALELKAIVEKVSREDYERIADAETEDEDCRSIQTIVNHVIHAGYSYANRIRQQFSLPFNPLGKERRQIKHSDIAGELENLLNYTIETLEGNWEMSYEEIDRTFIVKREDFSENLEQLLEHAIVHILRHRRQIEKFLLRFQG